VPKARELRRRTWPKALRGLGVGGGILSPLGKGSWKGAVPLPKFFWTFEWKMAPFGAFWVLFMQTAVI